MAVLEEAFDLVSSRFQISSLNDHQKEAIRSNVVNNVKHLESLLTIFLGVALSILSYAIASPTD